MDENTTLDQHETTLNGFNPADHQRQLGLLTTETSADAQAWESMRPKVAPLVWAWYDQHKDNRVATLGGFYRITVGSFHIAEMVITAIFGARPAEGSEAEQSA